MSWILFVGVALSCLHWSTSNLSWPELNPVLRKYQDLSKCFPLGETWYILYKNYEEDPYFGGNSKCIGLTQTKPPVNGEYPISLKVDNQIIEGTARFDSPDGNTSKSILTFNVAGQALSVEMYVSFIDCSSCAVVKSSFGKGFSCAALVPESQADQEHTCCDFIFDLLCDMTPKRTLYDESCQVANQPERKRSY